MMTDPTKPTGKLSEDGDSFNECVIPQDPDRWVSGMTSTSISTSATTKCLRMMADQSSPEPCNYARGLKAVFSARCVTRTPLPLGENALPLIATGIGMFTEGTHPPLGRTSPRRPLRTTRVGYPRQH